MEKSNGQDEKDKKESPAEGPTTLAQERKMVEMKKKNKTQVAWKKNVPVVKLLVKERGGQRGTGPHQREKKKGDYW